MSSEKEKKYCTDSGIEIKRIYSSRPAVSPEGGDLEGAKFPLRGGFNRICTGVNYGPCGNMPDFQPPKKANKRYHYLLSQGVNGLRVAFDLPTQIGYDSDHAFRKVKWVK